MQLNRLEKCARKDLLSLFGVIDLHSAIEYAQFVQLLNQPQTSFFYKMIVLLISSKIATRASKTSRIIIVIFKVGLSQWLLVDLDAPGLQ